MNDKFKPVKIKPGEDTPCKDCAWYWWNGHCNAEKCGLPEDEIYDFVDQENWKIPFGSGKKH